MSYRQKLLLTAILVVTIVVFFGSAIMFGNYNTLDIWPRIVGALFGVVLSAIITMLLLSGQTRNALEKERNAEIFKEKLRIYQEYLHKLCTVLEDGEITGEEAVELQFLTSYISLHTSSENIKKVSDYTAKIIELYLRDNNEKSLSKHLLQNLYAILSVFRSELYINETSWKDKDIEDAIRNFEIFDAMAVKRV